MESLKSHLPAIHGLTRSQAIEALVERGVPREEATEKLDALVAKWLDHFPHFVALQKRVADA